MRDLACFSSWIWHQFGSEREMLPKIIWPCSHCGTVLALWMMKCFNCHRLALSWLHLIAVAVIGRPVLLLLIRFL